MSIQRRLIAAVVAVLAISVLIGSILTYFHAVRKVRTEMRAAILVGTHIVRNAVDDTDEALDASRRLRLVVADFDGDRHLLATLIAEKNTRLAVSTPLAPDDPAPDWFLRLVGGSPIVLYPELPPSVESGGRIMLQTVAVNEAAEAWSDFKVTIVTLLIWSVFLLLAIYWIISRALRPIGDVCISLLRVSTGDYSTRVTGPLPSELEPLRAGFNTMAQRLANMESANHSLTKQLLNVQEEERAQIARDLHDEIGSFLFATGADATMIRQFLATSAISEAQARAQAIIESVRHMQRHLRLILGQLRPRVPREVGLEQAIRGLVEFWRMRRPDIKFTISVGASGLGHGLDYVAFRIIQESLSNAIRHAKPSAVCIAVAVNDGVADIEITDDGVGFPSPSEGAGFGLSGMEERVRSIGGSFKAGNRPDGCGAVVSARIPLTEDLTEAANNQLVSRWIR